MSLKADRSYFYENHLREERKIMAEEVEKTRYSDAELEEFTQENRSLPVRLSNILHTQ